jgi:hypothetical protein
MWKTRTNWGLLTGAFRVENGVTNWLTPPGPNATNGYSELRLQFSKPSLGLWFHPLTKHGSEKPDYYTSGADGEDETGTYKWSVQIRKQNPDDKK